jgi:hypothetical protein
MKVSMKSMKCEEKKEETSQERKKEALFEYLIDIRVHAREREVVRLNNTKKRVGCMHLSFNRLRSLGS